MKKIILRLLLVLFIISIVAIGFAVHFYLKFSSLKENVQSENTTNVKELISEVGKLVLLPQDEEPTVATITDPEKLKNQAFFANAKVGDKVLIYPISKKAFLYDPVAKKILEVAPLFKDQDLSGNK